jgi:hypothetical protein
MRIEVMATIERTSSSLSLRRPETLTSTRLRTSGTTDAWFLVIGLFLLAALMIGLAVLFPVPDSISLEALGGPFP